MDKIHLLISCCFFSLTSFARILVHVCHFKETFPQSLPFVYTYMYTYLYILLGERFEPVYFDFHVQKQIDLLALEMSTCTNHCFESDQNVTKP